MAKRTSLTIIKIAIVFSPLAAALWAVGGFAHL